MLMCFKLLARLDPIWTPTKFSIGFCLVSEKWWWCSAECWEVEGERNFRDWGLNWLRDFGEGCV